MPKRQSERDLYWGPDFRRKGGVNVLMSGGENGVGGVGGGGSGGWL